MAGIAWDPALEIGDPMIDDQHKELFRIVNDLRDACVASEGKAAIEGILDRLMTYVGSHFAAEEMLMFSVGYPAADTTAHVAAHAALRERAVELVREYRAGKLVTVLPLAEFLFDWLRSHIREVDARLVAHAVSVGGSTA